MKRNNAVASNEEYNLDNRQTRSNEMVEKTKEVYFETYDPFIRILLMLFLLIALISIASVRTKEVFNKNSFAKSNLINETKASTCVFRNQDLVLTQILFLPTVSIAFIVSLIYFIANLRKKSSRALFILNTLFDIIFAVVMSGMTVLVLIMFIFYRGTLVFNLDSLCPERDISRDGLGVAMVFSGICSILYVTSLVLKCSCSKC